MTTRTRRPEPERGTPLGYAGRCQRYARQAGWAYDEHRLSIDRLTPRQRRRAIKKERHAWDGYSRRSIDMPWDPRYALYNLDELSDDPGDWWDRDERDDYGIDPRSLAEADADAEIAVAFLGDTGNWKPTGIRN